MANILLNKNQSNTINPTLFELTTVSPAFYLFEFINQQTKKKTYCIPTELSIELQRYNEFIIIEKTSPNPLNGEVELSAGSYDYNVYEQTNNTNLDPTGLNIVEEGLCKVKGNTQYYTSYPAPTVINTQYE